MSSVLALFHFFFFLLINQNLDVDLKKSMYYPLHMNVKFGIMQK